MKTFTGRGGGKIIFNTDLIGSPKKDLLFADNSDGSLLSGGWATDYLFGGRGADTLDGGGWADFLSGRQGDDVYRFSAHDGGPGAWIDPNLYVDTIRDTGGYDVIQFDNTIDPASVTLYTEASFRYSYPRRSQIEWVAVETRDALFVSARGWDGTVLTIRIEGDAKAGKPLRAIEAIVFADGSTLSLDLLAADDPARAPTVVDQPGLFIGSPLSDFIAIADDVPNVSVAAIDGGDRIIGNDLANYISTAHYFFDSGADSVEGGGGDDTIEGGVGANSLHGGAGDDVIEGFGQAWGDAGDDVIRFADEAWGGDGADTLLHVGNSWGGDGDDRIVHDPFLRPRLDHVWPRSDREMHGGAGDDTLEGGSPAWGEAGGDRLTGTNFADFLHGGTGADRLIGLYGDDTLDGGGGPGVDFLWGGRGGDLFVVGAHANRTRIGDFSQAEGDRILLEGRTHVDLAVAEISLIARGGQSLVRFADGGEIAFDNLAAGAVALAWFQFG